MTRPLWRKAREFVIWRAGQSVGWDCTIQDIANETGLPAPSVGAICRAKGWVTRGHIENGAVNAPVDAIIASRDDRYRRVWL